MQILNIQGKKWLTGVEWEILPGDSTIKLEAKEVAEKQDARFGVIVEYDTTYAIGLVNKLYKEPSAALYLALANQAFIEDTGETEYPDWVVLEEIGDDKYWMSVIKSGIPAPQFDTVLSITDVKDRITELLINDTYTFYTSAGEIIAIFDGIKTINNRSLNDLTKNVKPKIKFQKLLGIPNSVIYAGIGVALLAVAGYAALQFVEGRNLEEKARLLKTKQEREKKAQKEKYNNEMIAFEKKKVELESQELNKIASNLSGNPSEILKALYNHVGNTKIGTHGWNLNKIECYYDVNGRNSINLSKDGNTNNNSESLPVFACDYLYERNSLATSRMLLEDFPDAKLNGDMAVVTEKVDINPDYIKKSDLSILKTIKSSKNWSFNLQSQLQLAKVAEINHEINPSNEITYKIPAKPLSPEEKVSGKKLGAENSVNLGIGMGELSIRSETFDWLKELADNIDFTGTGFKKIIFSIDKNKISWNTTFNYYVTTQDGKIGASSSAATADVVSENQPQNQVKP